MANSPMSTIANAIPASADVALLKNNMSRQVALSALRMTQTSEPCAALDRRRYLNPTSFHGTIS